MVTKGSGAAKNARRGKLIVFEGADGSGKRTQAKLLQKHLNKIGVKSEYIEFPRYDTPFGGLVANYLRGEFGELSKIPPEMPAILFALDRYQFQAELEEKLSKGTFIVANRYSESNLGYQSAKLRGKKKRDFIIWLEGLESRMPASDIVFYMHLPIKNAQKLISNRSDKDYLKGKSKDIHEQDVKYQEVVAKTYLDIARKDNKKWVVIKCSDKGRVKSRTSIHKEIVEQLKLKIKID
jgi:dTMP kinase